MDSILDEFRSQINHAYDALADAYWHLGRDDDGAPCFPHSDAVVQAEIKRYVGQLGAACGAAVKRAKRRLVFDQLKSARARELDITPSVAQGIGRRLLGRGFDNRAANDAFGTPGRTPAQKTATTVDDVLAIEGGIQEQLNELKKQMQVIKDHAGYAWFHSARRAEIMADWSWQRKHNK